MNAFLTVLAAGLVTTVPAAAATLRTMTTLQAPVVRLSDLFDEVGPRGARVLGPSPAPGARIVVEAAQLAAIARQFGVDWRPASSGDRAVLDRPGRPMPREQVLAVLRTALDGVGAPADGELELPGFVAPMLPIEAKPEAAIEQLDYEGAGGHFTATLAVFVPDMPVQRERLSGRVQEMTEVPVATHRLPAGAVLGPGDVQLARVRAGTLRGEAPRSPADAVGLALKRPAVAGQPLELANLVRPALVQKGGRVAMELIAPGLSLNGQGIALEAGGPGERIRVLNPGSRAVLEAEVVGPGRVRVAPGSAPLQSARPGAALAQAAPQQVAFQ